jgi:hypothetical protein
VASDRTSVSVPVLSKHRQLTRPEAATERVWLQNTPLSFRRLNDACHAMPGNTTHREAWGHDGPLLSSFTRQGLLARCEV